MAPEPYCKGLIDGDQGPVQGAALPTAVCLPSASACGRRARVGATGQPVEGQLRRILLCVVQVLAVVPEACSKALAVDHHSARPSRASSWRGGQIDQYLAPRGLQAVMTRVLGSLTSSIRYDLENGRVDLVFTTSICHMLVNCPKHTGDGNHTIELLLPLLGRAVLVVGRRHGVRRWYKMKSVM